MVSVNQFKNDEIIYSINTNNCCGYAFLSAVLKSGANFVESNSDIVVYVKNINKSIFELLEKTINNFYNNISLSFYRGECKMVGKQIGEMLVDAGIFNKENYSLNFGIDSSILEEDCCKITFLKALYLMTGKLFLNDKENQKTKGYHLEFAFKDYALMDDALALFESLNLHFKKHQRFNSQTLYAKNSETICKFFSLIGAVEIVLKIENNLTIRDVRNNINRANNCFDANLNKTIDASIMQLEAIKYIDENLGLEILDEEDKEIALLRLANPEAPLSTLQQLYPQKISRAGMKYKLDKIVKIYKNRKD